jgi:hypothetical protein
VSAIGIGLAPLDNKTSEDRRKMLGANNHSSKNDLQQNGDDKKKLDGIKKYVLLE